LNTKTHNYKKGTKYKIYQGAWLAFFVLVFFLKKII